MAASTASWTMLFGFVAIVLPPAPSWSRRYVPASTAVAMSRAMAMTALINKLTSRPFVFFGMFHPSPREQAVPQGGLPSENLAATVGDYNDAVRFIGGSCCFASY